MDVCGEEMEEDVSRMSYDTLPTAYIYAEWYPHGLHHVLVNHANLRYFGDELAGKSVIEFGCGNGTFLRRCAAMGASVCLGLDVNEAMIKAGNDCGEVAEVPGEVNGALEHQNGTADRRIRFELHDCFRPIDPSSIAERFDFAVCQFLLHECSNEQELVVFFENVLRFLKPGGKLFIGQCPYVAANRTDRETIADLCGFLQPTVDESGATDPYLARVPGFYPASKCVSETRRPFTRKPMFDFTDHYWSKERLMRNLENVGFVNIELLPQEFPDQVGVDEARRMQALEEPFILIGARKPSL